MSKRATTPTFVSHDGCDDDDEDHPHPDQRPDAPAEAATRRGIVAMSPFFVFMSRIMGVLLILVGIFLVVAGIAVEDGPNLVLVLVGALLGALGAVIAWGGPRYARTVRRYHGADA